MAKNTVASQGRKRHQPTFKIQHITPCANQHPTPKKKTFNSTDVGGGEEGEERETWLRTVVTLAFFVMINFAFKIGKSPLAAKRE